MSCGARYRFSPVANSKEADELVREEIGASGTPADAVEQGAPDPRIALVESLFEGTGATYDRMVFWATLGIDALWKRRLVRAIPAGARRILDLACGTGISTLAIARARPDCAVVGVELRDEYLAFARAKLARDPQPNVALVLSRAEDYVCPTPFDCISSSYLAKYADLGALVGRNRAMLAPGGLLQMHDFCLPPNRVLRAIWRLYFRVMQRTVARLMPSWRPIYVGLPKLIEAHPLARGAARRAARARLRGHPHRIPDARRLRGRHRDAWAVSGPRQRQPRPPCSQRARATAPAMAIVPRLTHCRMRSRRRMASRSTASPPRAARRIAL